MMIYMEEREMGELLLEDKEERVKHVNKLGYVEEPSKVQSSHYFCVVRIVDRLASPAVISSHIKPAHNKQSYNCTNISKLTSSPDRSPIY